MEPADLDRSLRRIAHEIVERNHGAVGIVLLGIPTRGVPLAHRLAALLSDFEGVTVPVGRLDIGKYRDDLDDRPARRLGPSEIPVDLDDRVVVLVDDVLYTGRSIRAALDAIADIGRPRAVQLAALIDRGHREIPIRPDYVGKNIPTSSSERVMVRLDDVDGEEGVWLARGKE